MAGKIVVPSTSNTSIQAPIGGKLSVQDLMNQAVDRYGMQSTPVIPGSEAAAKGVSTYNPEPVVPPLQPAPGLRGVVETNRISAESTPVDLAQATQSQFANRPRFEPIMDAQGQPQINPDTGEVLTQVIPMERFGEEQAAQLETVPNMEPALFMDNPVDMAEAIMNSNNTAGVNSDTIKRWADKSATTLQTVANNTEADLFSPMDAVIGSAKEGYEGVPVGIQIQHEFDIPQEYIKPISAIFGIAHVLATSETSQFKENPNTGYTKEDNVVYDQLEKVIDDATPEVNLINATIAAASNALERTGIDLPPEAVRQLAEAKVKAEIYQGRHRLMTDKDGKWVLASTPRLKDTARELAYVAESLAGDMKRSLPSKVPQLSGSNFLKPGSQTSKNSLPIPGMKTSVAEAVKDIFGSIPEQFNAKATLSIRAQLDHIENNLVQDNGVFYSTSSLAKRHKLDQETFKKLRERVQPPSGFNPQDPDAVNKFEQSKTDHAVKQMQAKLAALKSDLNAATSIKGSVYTSYIHSSANQRFFRNNAGTDIMSSKSGIREMLNFGIQGVVTPDALLNQDKINGLKEIANSVFSKTGSARSDALTKLTTMQRSALGLMEMAVINYYSFSADPTVQIGNIKKFSELELINMYTPQIAQTLASLGQQYNEFLSGKITGDSDFVVNKLARMPRGEAQGFQNLWDDMFNLVTKASGNGTKNTPTHLTALNYDDGNQNGIFIQALYAGLSDVSTRLGTYNPNLADMRGHALNIIGDHLERLLPDSPERADAWKSFFETAYKKLPEKLASDLFKMPMMQNSYGKDASMFFEHVREFLEDTQDYSSFYADTLSAVYGNDINAAASDLSNAMEATLRQAINPKFVETLKRVGRMFAVMDTVPTIIGTAGDSLIFSSTDCGFVPDYSKDVTRSLINDEGTEFIEKEPGVKSTTYMTPEGPVEAPFARRKLNPNASKGTQTFFNKKKQTFTQFENATGSALARQMGVMPIQSTDGDLIKLMMLDVNSKQEIPRSVATVHDALITTPDSMHIYRNSYNNVAIPQAVGEIVKFADKLAVAYDKAKKDMFDKTADEYAIGIGENGDYPSLGAIFDEMSKKINSAEYKEVFMRRSHNSEASWLGFVQKTEKTLAQAKAAGWMPNNRNLAVKPGQFRALFNIAEEVTGMGGANNKFKQWQRNFGNEVKEGFKELQRNAGKKGIAQMTHA